MRKNSIKKFLSLLGTTTLVASPIIAMGGGLLGNNQNQPHNDIIKDDESQIIDCSEWVQGSSDGYTTWTCRTSEGDIVLQDDGLDGKDNGLQVKSAPWNFAIEVGQKVYKIDLSRISGCQRIGENCFGSKSLDSILLPYGVNSLGSGAFNGSSLTMINIPDSVNTIESSCFRGCSLTQITIPNSVTSIGESCFSGCPLTEVTIGENITSLPGKCFLSCVSLSRINILTENDSFVLGEWAIDTNTSTEVNFNSKALYDKYSTAEGIDGWGNGQAWDESFGTTISFSNEYVDPTPDPVNPDDPSTNSDDLWSKFMWLWILIIILSILTIIISSVIIAQKKKKHKIKNSDKDLEKLMK